MFRTINEITFKVNPYCNLNCVYCFQTYETKTVNTGFAHYGELAKFMEVLPLGEQVEIKMTGGESSLFCDDIRAGIKKLRKIEHKKDVHLFFTTITNGTNLEGILALADDGMLDAYGSKFSWDGIYSCTKSRKPKNKNFTDEFFNNKIKLLGQSKYADKMLVRTAVTPDTVDDLYEAVKFCLDNGVTKWEYYLLTDCDEYRSPDFISRFKAQLEKIAKLKEERPFYFSNWETMEFTEGALDRSRENRLRSIGCRHLGKSIYVHDNGDIYPCGFFVPDSEYGTGEFKLGDIFNGFDKEQVKAFIDEYLVAPVCGWSSCQNMHCFECPATTKYRTKHMQDKLMQTCQIRSAELEVFHKYHRTETDEKRLMNIYAQSKDWHLEENMPELPWRKE